MESNVNNRILSGEMNGADAENVDRFVRQLQEQTNPILFMTHQAQDDHFRLLTAFEKEMTGRQYGIEERNDAFAWFSAGWKAK